MPVLDNPTPFVAEQVTVAPAVSIINVVIAQPLENLIPDSESLSFQDTVTSVLYHPLFPSTPATVGTITGGVVSSGSSRNA